MSRKGFKMDPLAFIEDSEDEDEDEDEDEGDKAQNNADQVESNKGACSKQSSSENKLECSDDHSLKNHKLSHRRGVSDTVQASRNSRMDMVRALRDRGYVSPDLNEFAEAHNREEREKEAKLEEKQKEEEEEARVAKEKFQKVSNMYFRMEAVKRGDYGPKMASVPLAEGTYTKSCIEETDDRDKRNASAHIHPSLKPDLKPREETSTWFHTSEADKGQQPRKKRRKKPKKKDLTGDTTGDMLYFDLWQSGAGKGNGR